MIKHLLNGPKILVVLLALGVLLVGALAPAGAQDGGEFPLPEGVTWDEINAVASQMYCDVCEGVPLDECESVACRQWREEIARQLGLGRTEDDIIDYFVERYGDEVSAIPRDETDRFLAFAVPVVLAAAIGVIGALQVRRLRQHGQHAGQPVRRSRAPMQERPVPDDVDPQLLERLLVEMENIDG